MSKIWLSAHRNKVQTRRALRRIAARLRREGRQIVFTNGCFDLLHAGHVTYLEEAKSLGDLLIVAVNSDASVRRSKGAGRPINPESDRVRVLAGLGAVDYVTVFSEDTPLSLIRELRPHCLVKGADWKEDQIVGAREVKSWGGKVKRVRFLPGRSSTEIIERIQRQWK